MTRTAATAYEAFAVAAPGLEEIVAAELASLGVDGTATMDGGVEFNATRRQLYEANLQLRTASRVLIRLARFRALTFAELEKRAKRIPWERVVAPGQRVALRVTCRKSRLYHSDAVAERIARDLVQRVQTDVSPAPPDEDAPDPRAATPQLIVVRFDHDHCTVSGDSSGALLHLRGYRASVTAAPLRETLAAALVLASGWNQSSPLLDPFCGSGTIPIEACLIAARIAPGKHRRFQFMDWPDFDAADWRRVHSAAVRNERTSVPIIVGSDRTASAIRAATENADRMGLTLHLRFEKIDALRVDPSPEAGWIVSNPPYGVRLGDMNTSRILLRDFGWHLRERFGGWRVCVLTPHDVRSMPGLHLKPVMHTSNGGLRVQALAGTVPGAAPRPDNQDGERAVID